MNRYVVDPHWHGYIVWYFYLGGIAAGAYALASMANLFGDEADRRASRFAHYLAFPLVNVCGVLLIVDLGRPERFWHMLIQSETFRPMFKWWSPMSVGSWGLSAFGAFSFVSFLGVLVEDGWIPRRAWSSWAAAISRGGVGKVFSVAGTLSAFFLGSYTGVLLAATNQPFWSDTTWLAPLFLASSASTGLAALILLARWRGRDLPEDAIERLEWADGWAIGLELLMLVAFALSLGRLAGPAFSRLPGVLIPAFVVPIGLVLPVLLKRLPSVRAGWAASLLILAGGFALRAAVVGMPIPWLLIQH
jgi:formate-dependent nitrite reductase membrane component NrfD